MRALGRQRHGLPGRNGEALQRFAVGTHQRGGIRDATAPSREHIVGAPGIVDLQKRLR